MAQLSSLSPKLIWHFFEQICSIPHPSKHEAQLSAWIVAWAQGEGLAVKQDAVGNIIIKKPATPGMENRKAVVLQAHIDMVPQANADTQHDFTQDPIDAYIDGEWVTARGTTLGADNGMGMAGCLAVLADKTIKHGPRGGSSNTGGRTPVRLDLIRVARRGRQGPSGDRKDVEGDKRLDPPLGLWTFLHDLLA